MFASWFSPTSRPAAIAESTTIPANAGSRSARDGNVAVAGDLINANALPTAPTLAAAALTAAPLAGDLVGVHGTPSETRQPVRFAGDVTPDGIPIATAKADDPNLHAFLTEWSARFNQSPIDVRLQKAGEERPSWPGMYGTKHFVAPDERTQAPKALQFLGETGAEGRPLVKNDPGNRFLLAFERYTGGAVDQQTVAEGKAEEAARQARLADFAAHPPAPTTPWSYEGRPPAPAVAATDNVHAANVRTSTAYDPGPARAAEAQRMTDANNLNILMSLANIAVG